MMSKIKNYFSESYSELKKVNWPTRQETVRLTLVVVLFAVGVAAFLGVLDILFSMGLRSIIL